MALVAIGRAASAADLRPSWECLPGETLFMVRVPDAKEFAATVGGRTKFGAVLMQPARLRKIGAILLEQVNKDAGDDVAGSAAKWLGRHGLAAEDLVGMLAGEFGAAAIASRADGGPEESPPLLLLVAWLETADEDAARRLLAATGSIVAEAIDATKDGPRPVTRTDLEVAGNPTIHVRSPLIVQQRRLGTAHLFVTRTGRRLLMAATTGVPAGRMQLNVKVGGNGIEIEPEAPAERQVPPEEAERQSEAAGELARDHFERFLARHGEADAGSPLADLLEAPGMRASLPAGVPLVEVIANPPAAATLVGKQAPAVRGMLAPFGLDAVGPIVWRQSLDGTVWRSNAFVTLPGPRHGLARILDEDSDPAVVPTFLTREPIGFQQVSLDLGKAYSLVREAVLGGEEPAPGNVFATAETMALATTGMELADVLSALGTRHWFVNYPPRIIEAIEHKRRAGADGGEPPPNPNPMAVVWRVEDEKPFAKLLDLAGRSTGGKVVEEQGFRSIRFPMGLSAFLGQGHLVLAIGEGVGEKTLAAIRTPPGDDAAFRTGEAATRAAELIPPMPGGLYGVADNRTTGGTLGLLVTMLSATSPDDVEPDNRGFFLAIREALPSTDEMAGILGAATAVWRADDRGILMQSASEMPAP